MVHGVKGSCGRGRDGDGGRGRGDDGGSSDRSCGDGKGEGGAYGYFVLLAVCSAICSAKFGFFCQAEHMNG